MNGRHISRLQPGQSPVAGDNVIDAKGGTLLPGLHDHHIHLMALAAALESVHCSPPEIRSPEQLAARLRRENRPARADWLRGIGYHPSVAGDIDRRWLDRHIPDRPARIQHRGGRLWVLNSLALEIIGIPCPGQPAGVEMVDGDPSGRLYECDRWLRDRTNSGFRDLAAVSNLLARYGITGITDTTPANGKGEWIHFQRSQHTGQLKQRVRMMGGPELDEREETAMLTRGELKIHLLESQLPELDVLHRQIRQAHTGNRAVAMHCVTRTELVFALSALQDAGTLTGDRIEHASVTPPELLKMIGRMRLRVVTQPHFIAERGDQYLSDVDTDDQPWLYRCAGFINENIPLAAGSDAPFGNPDPWHSIKAATLRQTPSGITMDPDEALTPEQALSLFLSDPGAPGVTTRQLQEGGVADLCLLDQPWKIVRHDPSARHVRCVWRDGELIYSRLEARG